MIRKYYVLLLLLSCAFTYAQSTITGSVTDENGMPIPQANIVIKGTSVGTFTDFDGVFKLKTDNNPPFTLRVSSVGFTLEEVSITSKNQNAKIILKEGSILDEVVISASRTPERIFESPVTVERFGLKQIKNTASADFYGGLENLKGVDINTNSLTFKSINTRGFATFANTRFMQLVDGMDNSAPALNFPLGNLLGMTETDVQSVELLPGASSALYGANAFNGILFMQSKNPFDHEGISGYFKKGLTNQKAAGENAYTDLGLRMATKFSNKFAAKVNFGYLKGTDWQASNLEDKLVAGRTRADYDYDGTNVYGDEVSTNIRSASGSGIIPNVNVSRTGYNERDLTKYNAESVKADWGLYFRPVEGSDLEISYVGKVGSGNTIYQGANRYNIANFFLQQHKIEVKNDNFFVRAYMNEDKAGDSYDMVFTGININRAWKSDKQWFKEYIETFAGLTISSPALTDDQKHAQARKVADTGRFLPGSSEFKAAFNRSVNDPNLSTGSKFQDNSRFYHTNGNYNFKDIIKFAEVQVGGSYRQYQLNSGGTIYTDTDRPIVYSEFGVYTQAQKEIELDETMKLKLTGSLRYDKSELFEGFFSPRLSAGLTVNKNHNIRGSFQSGFRNPATQDLFIGLDVGRAILIGGSENNPSRYSSSYPVSVEGQTGAGQPTAITQSANAAYTNSYFATSVEAFGKSKNAADLKIGNSNYAKPEQVSSFEIGYRGKVNKYIIDFSTYYNIYKNFLANENVIAPLYGKVGDNGLSLLAIKNGDYKVYQTYTNSEANVSSYGAAIGVTTKFKGFDLGANYTLSKLEFDQSKNPDFETTFNTPEHKVKASLGREKVIKNLGFNVAWRWSDDYKWESSFGDGAIPAYHTLDAQLNYTIPKIKSTVKVGGTNLLGNEYFTAIGTGFIGSMYYASLTINNL